MEKPLNTLIVTHPGSLFGSAEFNTGRVVASKVRLQVLEQIRAHRGHFIVIDGFLSDEIQPWFNSALTDALEQARGDGAKSFRIWGCGSGARPFASWRSYGDVGQPIFFRQGEAALWISSWLTSEQVEVTGAWATADGSSGSINDVCDVLRRAPGIENVVVSDSALFQEYVGAQLNGYSGSKKSLDLLLQRCRAQEP